MTRLLAPLAAVGLDETPHHPPGLVLIVELPPEYLAGLRVAGPGRDVPPEVLAEHVREFPPVSVELVDVTSGDPARRLRHFFAPTLITNHAEP